MIRRVTTLAAGFCGIGVLAAAQFGQVPADYEPPFFPEGTPLEGLVITVDPGHGGSSFSEGYHGSARGTESRVIEGDLNMRVSGLVYHHLRMAGAEVHLTRRDDRKVTLGATGRSEELGARTDMAAETNSHLFLSLHHNSAPRETADGVVILIWPTDDEGNEQPLEIAFADLLEQELRETVHWTEDFPHYLNEHPLVANLEIPSAVVEFGFLSNAEFDAWVTQPTAARAEARGVYEAVVRMWQEHGEELRSMVPREEYSVAVEPDGPFPLGRPASRFWPHDRTLASAEEADWFVNTWKKMQLSDATTFYVDADVEWDDGLESVTIRTNQPRVARALETELEKAAGEQLDTEIIALPQDTLGVEDSFGVVDIPMAMTWAEPREGSGEMTQLLHGEPLFLLDRTEDETYWLVQGIDGYWGWVRSDAVKQVTREEFTRRMQPWEYRIQTGATGDDFITPPGSLVRAYPEGAAPPSTMAPRGDIAAATAVEEFLYVPYNFGGRSHHGIDCSGLVGVSWMTAGVQLPRDASQQALVGRLVATPYYLDGLRPGDNIFFTDETGRVWHTGISLGGGRFIHSSLPEVQISSLDPDDELYDGYWAAQFAFGRRPAW